MTDIGRELLSLITDRRSEWAYSDEWVVLAIPPVQLRAYPAAGDVALLIDYLDRRGVLSGADVAALAPVVAALTADLRATTSAGELRDVRKTLGLPQEGE